ncbi:diacylglycerol kinase family protein [Streptomyces griseosporeus]|uniref:hypothetical protein n=1 Tax=Streptomyces griseosporeus TaxID=1910 RepID=UPI0036B6726E
MTTALPSRPADALVAAPRGTARRVDLGRIEGDSPAAIHFAAMSGAGLDAAMLQHADDSGRGESVPGRPAYAVAGLRVLTSGRHLPRRSDLAP